MSGHQNATLGDSVYFWFGANDTSGSGGDGATPLFDVREAGAVSTAAPLLSGTPTLLTDAGYPAGCYEVAVVATTGNGFAAGDTFAVFCTIAIDTQNPTGFIGSCTLTPLAKTRDAGYQGFIHIDTVGGSAGTANDVNGTWGNPVNNLADATTLASSMGIMRFHLHPGSSITLAQAYVNYTFAGENWTLALGGRDISNSHITGAAVSGIATAPTGEYHLHHCEIGTVTLAPGHIQDCGIEGGITVGAAGDFHLVGTYSLLAGISNPYFDFGAAIADTSVILSHRHGIEIRNMGQLGTDRLSVGGCGTLVMAASNIGGTLKYTGTWDFDDSSSGMTIISDDNAANILDTVTDTNELQADWVNGGRLDNVLDARASQTTADAIETDTQDLQTQIGTAGLGLSNLGGMSTGMKAEVNAEVVDTLATDTYALPGQEAPTATPTISTMMAFLYKRFRNKTEQTAGAWSLYDDAGTVVDQKTTVSDDATTATKGEIISGP